MGTRSPNMSIYIPDRGEDLYASAFFSGQMNIDAHDHSGAPENGVPIGTAGIEDGSITPAKTNGWAQEASITTASDGTYAIAKAGASNLITGIFYLTWQGTNRSHSMTFLVDTANSDGSASSFSLISNNCYQSQNVFSNLRLVTQNSDGSVYILVDVANRNSGSGPIKIIWLGNYNGKPILAPSSPGAYTTANTYGIGISTTGAINFNNEYTFPLTDGTANQVLKTDGSGQLSFASDAGSSSYSAAAITVSPIAGQGDYTTITAANAAASAGQTILIKEGTYTENFTAKPGIAFAAWNCNALEPNVIIQGKITCSTLGTYSFSGIRLQTNGDYFLVISGTDLITVNLSQCYLYCTNNTGINFSNSNAVSVLLMLQCNGDLATTGIAYYTMSSPGYFSINHSIFYNRGFSTTPSNNSNGNVYWVYSVLDGNMVSTSSSGNINIQNSICYTSNQISLVTAGTGSHFIHHSIFGTGSASSISIGSGTTVTMLNSGVSSSNTNAITGAGTLNAGLITFYNTSSTINTSTVNKLTTYGGTIV